MDKSNTGTSNEVIFPMEDEMDAFDRLPAPLREVIRNAPQKYAAHTLEDIEEWTADELREAIEQDLATSDA